MTVRTQACGGLRLLVQAGLRPTIRDHGEHASSPCTAAGALRKEHSAHAVGKGCPVISGPCQF